MGKEKRTLTERERRRKEKFETLCREMEEQGYTAKPMTVGVVKANLLAVLIMLPFVVVFAWIYFLANPTVNVSISEDKMLVILLAYIALMFVLIVAHELIHGLTWGIFAQNHFRSIEFGVIWSMLTPYCTCSAPLKKWQYLLGGAMPTLVLGFGLGAVSAAVHSGGLFLLAELMIFAGGGDFLILLNMLRYRPDGRDAVYYDHPTECGFVVFQRET
jgi:hypothetical protein